MQTYRWLSRWQDRILPAEVVMLNRIGEGIITSRCVWIAVELGLADHLARGPMAPAELARLVGAHPDALYRVLRTLASSKIFKELPDGRFALNRLARPLRSDAPASIRDFLRYIGTDWHWTAWASLMPTIQNGRSVHENVHGQKFFEYYESQHYTPLFDAAMSSISGVNDPAIVAGYRFADYGSIVDVAGGEGTLLAAILEANPRLHGTLYDRAPVIARAQHAPHFASASVRSRVQFKTGNVFESVPAGFDGYLMKWILHDWDDEEAGVLLRSVRRAAQPGARLIVVEMVVDRHNHVAKQMDITMLALTGGRERTASEYGMLMQHAGFRLQRVCATASPFSVLEAVAV